MNFKLKEFRKKRGLSQEELSVKSNISRSIISGLESGKITVTTTATLKNLSKALDCKVSDIFLND